MAQPTSRTIFFTVFEPSGDVLAARLIRSLKERDASLRFVGYGGPKMRDAGCELIETTTEHATIALSHGLIGEIKTHRARIKRVGKWLDENDILAHVPVDSPAANWALCKQVREHRPNAKIVHLVCPQIWGWATWRVHRLRRLTDRVLCLLPFEQSWLGERGVPGVFVGHPVFEEAKTTLAEPVAGDLPHGSREGERLALMPGSRRGELTKNWASMLLAFNLLKRDVPGLVGVVAARGAQDAKLLETITKEAGLGWPAGLVVEVGRTPEVLRWADVVLVKSGTSTLQVASMGRPMVAFYNVSRTGWHLLGRWLIKARTFALPNVISEWQDGVRAVPELIPHFGDPGPIAAALRPLLTDPSACAAQREALTRVREPFDTIHFGDAAAQAFLEVVDGG